MHKDSIKIPKDVRRAVTQFAKDLVREADRQEAEFLFPFIKKNAVPKIKKSITVDKLIDRGIKRVWNEDRCEVWYEQRGQVITPIFIRDNQTILDSVK